MISEQAKARLVLVRPGGVIIEFEPVRQGDVELRAVCRTVPGDPMVAAARAAGAVYIDMSNVSAVSILEMLLAGPSPCEPGDERRSGKDGEGLDGLGYLPGDRAPLSVIAALAAKRGAVVENVGATGQTVH